MIITTNIENKKKGISILAVSTSLLNAPIFNNKVQTDPNWFRKIHCINVPLPCSTGPTDVCKRLPGS